MPKGKKARWSDAELLDSLGMLGSLFANSGQRARGDYVDPRLMGDPYAYRQRYPKMTQQDWEEFHDSWRKRIERMERERGK